MYYSWLFIPFIQFISLIHCIVTKKDTKWLFIILFFPGLGGIIYLILEVLPLYRLPSVDTVTDTVIKKVNPTRAIEKLKEELAISATIKNKQALADEYNACGYSKEAIDLYNDCLNGMYAEDTVILLKLAKALFNNGEYSKASEILNKILSIDPKYRASEVNLLLAMSYDKSGSLNEAKRLYEYSANTFAELEIKFRYAMFLKKSGDNENSKKILEQLLLIGKRLPRHSKTLNRRWLALAKKNYN